MLPKNWIAKKVGHALSVWASCTTILISYSAKKNFDTIFVRAIIGFLVFGLLGYIGGWLIEQSMRPELSFIYKDDWLDNTPSGNLQNNVDRSRIEN